MELAQFDRDITLAELLRGISSTKLDANLDGALGTGWSLVDCNDTLLLGSAVPVNLAQNFHRLALRVELDTIGHLCADCVPERIARAAAWLELVLAANYRYSMASDLHLETVFIN
jgi:hypothetical protein